MYTFPNYSFLAGHHYKSVLPELEKTLSAINPRVEVKKIEHREEIEMLLTFISESEKQKVVKMIQERFQIGMF